MTQINLAKYKPIPNYSRYLVSESGDVYDTETQRPLVPNINGGYKCLNLFRDDGKKVLEKVHRCVAYTYLVKPENSTNNLLHKTEDRLNNHVSNLEWKVKGVTYPMYKRFSNYHGVKYHLTELEEISEKSGLPLWTVRNRLEDGYTPEEIYQGYKNSDIRWYDGLVFTNLNSFSKFVEMLDEDVRKKERYMKQCEWREARFMEEVRREALKESRAAKFIVRGTDSSALYKEAKARWRGLMGRCYSPLLAGYKYYGGSGATVCGEWHDPDVFCKWYIQNKIDGWDVEKDILQTISGGVYKQYSPENCCFVPKYINQWFALTRGVPPIRQNKDYFSMPLSMTRYDRKKKFTISAHTEVDLKEQYFLIKDLHLEKQFWRMKEEWKHVKRWNPNSPEIHPALIQMLESFCTEKYLSS